MVLISVVVSCGRDDGTTVGLPSSSAASATTLPAGKANPLYSPDMVVTVSPTSGPAGTVVQIEATGCKDTAGAHAVSFNNDAQNTSARFDPNTVRSIESTQRGTTLTATYQIVEADRTGGTGAFFVQCAATVKTAPFTVATS